MWPTSGPHPLSNWQGPNGAYVRALLLAALLSIPSLVEAQDSAAVEVQWSPLVGAVATTGCMGGRIYMALDMDYIGTEIFEEVVQHERFHRHQYEVYLAAHNGICPSLPPLQLLDWEIGAYCDGREMRHHRELSQVGDASDTGTAEAEMVETDLYNMALLVGQFKDRIPQPLVALLYTQRCLEK